VSVSCESFVLSGRGLCIRLIPCPEESYQVCVCVCVCVLLSVVKGNIYLYTYNEYVERVQDKERRKKVTAKHFYLIITIVITEVCIL
jgi:hypothetical protein